MAEHADLADRPLTDLSTAGDRHEAEQEPPASTETTSARPHPNVRTALVVSLGFVMAIGGLCGWLGYRAYRSHETQQRSSQFVAVGRQAALNLTTISYTAVDADVRRIVDSSTGTFHDDFQKRAQPFIDVVKQAQSKSQGTVTAAGIESEHGDQANVIVAVSVTTSSAGAPKQPPRLWRMRIGVQNIAHGAKISNVEFVP